MKDLIFSPKIITEPSDKIVVVVPPRKVDSICMCEEELENDELNQSDMNILADGDDSQPEKQQTEIEGQLYMRQTTSEKSKRVSISTTVKFTASSVTARPSPTDIPVIKEDEVVKANTEEEEAQLTPNSQDDMFKLIPFEKVGFELILDFHIELLQFIEFFSLSQPPSETIVVNETTSSGVEDKEKVFLFIVIK